MTVIIDGTSGITPAQWTTAGRPSSPTVGQSGWNTTRAAFEVFIGSGNWQVVASTNYTASYLVVAGGGAGGSDTGQNVGSGGGGGGAGSNNVGPSSGGNGGSGVVIIAYLGSQRGTGGTVTSSGGYTIHTFTASGTYTA